MNKGKGQLLSREELENLANEDFSKETLDNIRKAKRKFVVKIQKELAQYVTDFEKSQLELEDRKKTSTGADLFGLSTESSAQYYSQQDRTIESGPTSSSGNNIIPTQIEEEEEEEEKLISTPQKSSTNKVTSVTSLTLSSDPTTTTTAAPGSPPTQSTIPKTTTIDSLEEEEEFSYDESPSKPDTAPIPEPKTSPVDKPVNNFTKGRMLSLGNSSENSISSSDDVDFGGLI